MDQHPYCNADRRALQFKVDQERMNHRQRALTPELQSCSNNWKAIMNSSTPRFAIVFEPASRGTRTALKTTDDANEATVAYHAALRELRIQGLAGNVFLRTQDAEPVDLLRQPVMAGSR